MIKKKTITKKKPTAKKIRSKKTYKKREMPLMKCGHVAQSIDPNGNPVCVICIGINPGATEKAHPISLTGRMARCSSCGNIVPSSYDLPFFELQGYTASCTRPELIKKHNDILMEIRKTDFEATKEKLRVQLKSIKNLIKKYTPIDAYYCGCRGWD